MTTQIALRFVTGQYHATGWDHAINEGISEWPPSPWRLLRALLSVWHTRCHDIPERLVEELVTRLAAVPPCYLLPPVTPSQTRHYMPTPGFRAGDSKPKTTLMLAARLNLNQEDEVVVSWDVDLASDLGEALGVLMRKLPYVGRAESQCSGRLIAEKDHLPVGDGWARPSDDGAELVLVPNPDVTREQLELSPLQMRKSRLRYPPGSSWMRYDVPLTQPVASRPEPNAGPTAVRWRIESPAAFRYIDGILATHGLRGRILGSTAENEKLRKTGSGIANLAGPHGSPGDGPQHRHAHWLWLPNREPGKERSVGEVVLWVPDGIPGDVLGRVASARSLPHWNNVPCGYRNNAELHLQLMGAVNVVLPEYVDADATTWVSETPFLTDRMPKKNRSRQSFAKEVVERELQFRFPGGFPPVEVELLADWEDRKVVRFRRYRWNESMADSRRGMMLRLRFENPLPLDLSGTAVPLALGSLSHFGFGLFKPE